MKTKILSILRLLIFLSIGVFLIWIIIRKLSQEEIKEIKNAFANADYLWALFSIGIGIVSHISRAMRWNMMLKPMGYRPSLKTSFYAVMVGYVSNLAFHRVGEVIRCGIMKKYSNIPLNITLGTVIVERAIDFIMLFIVFLLVVTTQMAVIGKYIDERIWPRIDQYLDGNYTPHFLTYIILGVMIFSIVVIIIFRKKLMDTPLMKRIMPMIDGFVTGLKSIRQVKNLPLFILHTIFIWFMYLMMIYIGFKCITETGHLSMSASLNVLLFGSIAIVIIQGGIGAYPIVVAEILEIYDVSYPIGYACGWIIWSAQTIMIISVGLASLALLSFNKNKSYEIT